MRTRQHPPTVIYVSVNDEQVHRAIMRAWNRLIAEDARVPQIVVSLTPGRGSSCTSVGWRDSQPILEVNLRPDGQDGPTITGADLMQWLTHQAAHGIAGPSTSSEGRWHGRAFAEAAEALGLEAGSQGTRVAGTGYSDTSLAPGTRTRYRPEIAALDRALASWSPTDQVKATRDARNGIAAACSCSPPRRIRMRGKDAERVFDLGPIRCEVCGEEFRLPPLLSCCPLPLPGRDHLGVGCEQAATWDEPDQLLGHEDVGRSSVPCPCLRRTARPARTEWPASR